MRDRAEMRREFIAGYFEAGGKPEKLDAHLRTFGFRTTAEEAREHAPDRADYDDSPEPVGVRGEA